MQGLGALESRVMDVLWRAWDDPEGLSVREVRERLCVGDESTLAYTTVMTVLDNLNGKGWARREREGRAWLYRASSSREEAGADVLRRVLDASGDAPSVLAHFIRKATPAESDLLRRILSEDGPRA